MWDQAAVTQYEEWFETRSGKFALQSELKLLDRCLSSWPRRSQTLLEVGCGPGIFLKYFFEAGFDTTGLDASPAMLEAARRRMGSKADLRLGQADHLPFQDKEFDFVALLTVLEFGSSSEDRERILQEARRVARKGLIITYLNKMSLYYLGHGIPVFRKDSSSLRRAKWFTPFGMRFLLHRAVGQYPIFSRCVLHGPCFSWRPSIPWRQFNQFLALPVFGAYCAARVDLVGDTPLTPLYVKSRRNVGGEPQPL